MCLCEGRGSVAIVNRSSIEWHKCPDTNCTFDRVESDRRWKQFKKDMREWEKRVERESSVVKL